MRIIAYGSNFLSSTKDVVDDTFKYRISGTTAEIIDYYGDYESVIIPQAISYKHRVYRVETISKNLFKDKSISSLTVSSGLKKIDTNAFSNTAINRIYFEGSKADYDLWIKRVIIEDGNQIIEDFINQNSIIIKERGSIHEMSHSFLYIKI